MVNDSPTVLERERYHDDRHHHHRQFPRKLCDMDRDKQQRNGVIFSNGHGDRNLRLVDDKVITSKDKDKDKEEKVTTTETTTNGHETCSNGSKDDELTKLSSEDSSNGSSLVAHRQKSATLTPSSTGGSGESNGDSSFKRFSPASSGSQNAFMYNARNNLRRSFTLPRGLLLRKSGQTGPASENQNGNFVRNIFLTLVRSKSVRKKSQVVQQQQVEAIDLVSETQDPPSKLHGLPPGFIPAAVGLKNQGNTCFMNSIVQCLSHTDSLARYLVADNYKIDLRKKHWIKNGKSEVTEELASILKNMWLRQNVTVLEDGVTRFKSAVEKGATQWRGSEQHDAQEFFLWLLDKLHEDLNQASSNKYKQLKNNFGRPEEQVAAEALANHLRCNNSIIQDIFGAHFRSSLTCPGCGKQSATFDPFLSVSLPIPQAKHEVPVYVNIIYLSQQPRQVKLGLSLSSCADIKELKLLLATDTNIEENDILLIEVDGEGFHRTFTETQLVSSLASNEALYCIETPQIRETTESDGAFLMITWTNLLVTDDEKTKVRFGSTYVTQIARETAFVDLQKVLLKEMAAMLQPGVLVAEQKDPVFSIRILDGSAEGSLVDPLVEHPLYMEAVDHALSLCDEGVPSHIKIHLEWQSADKEKIIGDDSESVEEHASIAITRQRHAEEAVGSVTLGECFDLYTSAEQLSAEDSWHCPHCNRKEQGTLKMIGLWTAPQVLVVHLKRFRQTAKVRVAATKISSVVDFPVDGLDLGPHVTAPRAKFTENGIVNGSLNPVSSPINGCFGLGIGNWKHR
ncbi:Ubiquitin carboxyl-terminal hydrolase 43 [Folsomia candida]|uniref:ubiquitinyl hydrolase 1 n=2 Tax=Folsomia candida TaxID=158441 RepID=A0A226EPY3_FOLCA|nr:Ubiquitin carboxyl-terminal hydrolase 43 [Folsomia candida]